MAFLHLVNCVILTFAPIFLIFNTTALHEYGARICVGGVIGYVMTAALKLVAYSSLVPNYESWTLYAEVIKELVGLIDIYILMRVFEWKSTKIGDKRSRMLGIGLGWAAAELALSHLLIFLFNAGGGEFTWEYLQRSIHANCEVAQLVAFACLVWVWMNDKGFYKMVALALLGVKIVGFPIVQGLFLSQGLLNPWTSIAFEAVYSFGLALATKFLVELALI